LHERDGSGTLPFVARRSRFLVVSVVLAIVAVALAAVVLRNDLRCAGFVGPGVTAAELPQPCPPGRLRIATWNLRNFPLDERRGDAAVGYLSQTNICDLEGALEGLGADVLGLAEIRDARRFPPILRRAEGVRRYRVAMSRHGGRSGQRLAIAWDDRVLEAVGSPVEIREVALDEGLRPAIALRLRSRSDPGADLTVVQVHLKSSPSGYQTRMAQHRALVEWLRREHGTGSGGRLVVMGDFNSTGGKRRSAAGELADADRLYDRIGLARTINATGCSEYWEGGGEPDGLLVPSLLDHIWLRGFGDGVPQAMSWLHCRRRECAPFESRAGNEDGTFWDVSDHCPVTVDLPWPPVAG
jgi:endonuclease/exonuclease/phosphatase family metal-dependent hydrolase